MKRTAEKIVLFLIAAVFILWAVYHIVFYAKGSIDTETVFLETVARSIEGNGLAIRDEQNLKKTGSGRELFLYDDGTKVGLGQPVVEYFSGDVKNRNIQNIRFYEAEISQLESAQNKNLNNFSTATIISRDIREQLADLSIMTSTGGCDELGELRDEISHLVNRREVAIGRCDDYNDRISELQEQVDTLRASVDSQDIQLGTAPVSGYIAKKTDGLETKITPENMLDLSISEMINAIDTPLETNPDGSGKIVTSSKWYFVMEIPTYEAEWIRAGQKAQISFPHILGEVPAKVYDLVLENNADSAILILVSDYISEDIVNIRYEDATIRFTQFSGLRVNTSSIRFEEDADGNTVRGVYVLENYVAKFKPIEPIYEEQSFVLSKYSGAQPGTVGLYDQVITQRNDLFDGKVMQ